MLASHPLETLGFVFSYAWHSVLPSLIWNSCDPAVVCQSLGIDPADVLLTLQPELNAKVRFNGATLLGCVGGGKLFCCSVL